MSNFVEIKDKDGAPLGQLPVSSEGGRLRNIVYMTGSGDYTKPTWLKFVIVKGVGGGGGGGGTVATTTNRAMSGAGCSGGFFEKKITAEDLAVSETVTIGAGGLGGEAGNNTGQAGGTTSFGTHCSATGGSPGGGSAGVADTAVGSGNPTNPGPGVATGGDINIIGNFPPRGVLVYGIGTSLAIGAHSPFSGGAPVAVNSPASNASGPGGGGSGAYSTTSQPARAGGNGAAGIVVIEEYE